MYGLKPVPFVQSDSCSAYAGVESPAYQPVPFKTDKQSRVVVCRLSKMDNHQVKLKDINLAFSPFPLRLTLITQADGLSWYKSAPLALSFAGAVGRFSARIAVQLRVGPIHAIALLSK